MKLRTDYLTEVDFGLIANPARLAGYTSELVVEDNRYVAAIWTDGRRDPADWSDLKQVLDLAYPNGFAYTEIG